MVPLVTFPPLHAEPSWSIIALRRSKDSECRPQNSVHRRPAAALFVLLPGAAGAHFIPPHFGSGAPGLRCASTRPGLPTLPEILICLQQPSRHVHDDFFALLRCNRLGAHLRVFVV